jgi:serine/threonine protein kinase
METATTTELPQEWSLAAGDEIAPGLLAEQLLGGGSRYEAYLAFDERLHHLVVVKVLRPDRLDDRGARRGLRGEAEVLSGLNHPAIARLLRAELEAERPHLVLELVEGPRLSTLVRRFGPIESVQAAPLAVEVASALHYLHNLGLVHLDVKPKNLIMGAPPRLIDLSIARTMASAAELDVPIGTDAYMAPEQCIPARGRVGPPADVWGLGATLYEALAGRPAFPAGDPESDLVEERFPQLVEGIQPLPKHVPEELRNAVEASLAFEPADRPAAREVADLVEPLLRHPRRMVLNQLKPRTRRE